jgi:hypothetical protein
MPRTTYFEGWTVDTLQQELPIWVLSLARAKDRRAAMIEELKAAGANFCLMLLSKPTDSCSYSGCHLLECCPNRCHICGTDFSMHESSHDVDSSTVHTHYATC